MENSLDKRWKKLKSLGASQLQWEPAIPLLGKGQNGADWQWAVAVQTVAIKPLSVAVTDPMFTAVSYKSIPFNDLHLYKCPRNSAASLVMLSTNMLRPWRIFAGCGRHPQRRLISSIWGSMDWTDRMWAHSDPDSLFAQFWSKLQAIIGNTSTYLPLFTLSIRLMAMATPHRSPNPSSLWALSFCFITVTVYSCVYCLFFTDHSLCSWHPHLSILLSRDTPEAVPLKLSPLFFHHLAFSCPFPDFVL